MAKDLKYKIKGIRMHEDTWIKFKDARSKSGKSWNQYILSLIEKPLTKRINNVMY